MPGLAGFAESHAGQVSSWPGEALADGAPGVGLARLASSLLRPNGRGERVPKQTSAEATNGKFVSS